MFYFFLAASSFIFMIAPMTLNPLGRILAGWSFLACLIYGLILAGTIDNSIIPRALYAQASFDGGMLTPQGITAILCFALAVFAGTYRRKRTTSHESIVIRIQTPSAISVTLIVFAVLISFYLLYELGIDTLLSYSGYGTIKDLGGRFEDNPLGKVIAGIYRPIILLLIVDATMRFKQREMGLVAAAMVPILIAFVIGLAEGSRVTALYLLIFAGCSYIIGNRRAFYITLVPIVLVLAYSREARAHDVLGLSYVFEYMTNALNGDFFTGTISNIAGGHLATSATTEVARPELYSFDYKILSYLPSLGAIDDFQIVKSINEQRIADSFPFNAFGESWAFGLPFYCLLWLILFLSAKATIDSSRFGGTFHAVANAIFIYGFLCATQYPVRNVFRYFYALLAIYFIAKWLASRQMRQRDVASPANRGPRLSPQ